MITEIVNRQTDRHADKNERSQEVILSRFVWQTMGLSFSFKALQTNAQTHNTLEQFSGVRKYRSGHIRTPSL